MGEGGEGAVWGGEVSVVAVCLSGVDWFDEVSMCNDVMLSSESEIEVSVSSCCVFGLSLSVSVLSCVFVSCVFVFVLGVS